MHGISAKALNRWREGQQLRRLVIDVLEAAKVGVNYIHSTDDERDWGLMLRLPPDLSEIVGTQREVLLWGTLHDHARALDIEKASTFLAENSMRLTQDVLLVVTSDPKGRDVLMEAASGLPVSVMAVTTENLRGYRPRGSGDFAATIRAQLFARDLYDLRAPVTSNSDFFGRTELLNQLESSLTRANSHIAIFGLRKIGKTSFLLRLRETLRNRGDNLIAQVDLQRANAINPSAEYLLWHLGESLWDSSRRVRALSDLRLFGRYVTFSDVPDPRSIFEYFDHDIRLIKERIRLPVVLVMDEIERIFPTYERSPWVHDFVKLWQLLRGIDQESPGTLRFVISGTNPQCVEKHDVFGEDNPIYAYFTPTFLGPLDPKETSELLRGYGSKMGLDWAEPTVKRVFDDTGGHPALLRTYASMVHERTHPRRTTHKPSVEEAREIASNFMATQGPLLAQIVAILEDQYEDEFEILLALALGRVHDFRELARAFPEDTAHLTGYGLCGDPSHTTRLGSQLLQTYLQRREQSSMSTPARPSVADLVGCTVDQRYRVVSLISTRGGMADVYAAESDLTGSREPDVAIKVLRHGRLSVLEREVEILQRFSSPGIVKFLGSGRLDDGRVYLAMEFLEGSTLRSYCEAATRPSEARLLEWAAALLDALIVIHPRERELRSLRATAVTGEDLQELLEARYGYIHRDVKPENIIVTSRGPVLIDFNISSRVSDPVSTVSATPGYLPIELLGPEWSPRIDLYQLGVTLLQVAAGDKLLEDNRHDLVLVMRSSVSSRTATLIEKLIDTSEDGYHTAFTARRDLARLLRRS